MVKIISGGQSGADRGAVEAAYHFGYPTGGYAPMDYYTETGVDYDLIKFGLVQAHTKGYLNRTLFNVLDSHGTIIFGKESGGTKKTIAYCIDYVRPYLMNPTPEQILAFVKLNNIKVLNVAGNRESKNPGLQKKVYDIITEFLDLYDEQTYGEG